MISCDLHDDTNETNECGDNECMMIAVTIMVMNDRYIDTDNHDDDNVAKDPGKVFRMRCKRMELCQKEPQVH